MIPPACMQRGSGDAARYRIDPCWSRVSHDHVKPITNGRSPSTSSQPRSQGQALLYYLSKSPHEAGAPTYASGTSLRVGMTTLSSRPLVVLSKC